MEYAPSAMTSFFGAVSTAFCICMEAQSPVKNLFAAPDREQHLGEKPFPIHIPAGLGKPRGGALLSAEKKVVYMKHSAVIPFGENFAERRFAARAPALNGETHGGFSGEPPVKLREQRGETVGLVCFVHIGPPWVNRQASAAGIS